MNFERAQGRKGSAAAKKRRKSAAPAIQWRDSVTLLYCHRKKHLAAGQRLLRAGRLDTLRLSPGHIQGFIYTCSSQFVLVNIKLAGVCPQTLFDPGAMVTHIECSDKRHPGLSCYAAATLLAVSRLLRRDRQATRQLLPGIPASGQI